MADLSTDFDQDLYRMNEYDAFDLQQMLKGANGFIPYMSGQDRYALLSRGQNLYDEFDKIPTTGKMQEWETRVRDFFIDLKDAVDREPDPGRFRTWYTMQKEQFYFFGFEHCQNTTDDKTPKADAIRSDIRQCRTFEELEAIISGLQAMDVPDHTRRIIDGRIKEGMMHLGDRYTRALNSTSSVAHSFEGGARELGWILESACRAIEIDPDIPADIVSQPGGYAAARKAKLEARLAPSDDRLDMLAEKVADIQNIKARMDKEGSRFFGDSKEYKDMRAAVNVICSIAEEGIDFSDPRHIEELEHAMGELNEAAHKYADKEAFKKKSTSTGISRKNMALTLIDLSSKNGYDPHYVPRDMRRSKSDKKGSKRTFSELLAEEKESNRSEFKHTKESVRPARQRRRSDPQMTDKPQL